jgi:hypothetical protein
VTNAPATFTAFWLQEHAIVGFFMNYKPTMPRAAKISIFFNIMFFLLLLTCLF